METWPKVCSVLESCSPSRSGKGGLSSRQAWTRVAGVLQGGCEQALVKRKGGFCLPGCDLKPGTCFPSKIVESQDAFEERTRRWVWTAASRVMEKHPIAGGLSLPGTGFTEVSVLLRGTEVFPEGYGDRRVIALPGKGSKPCHWAQCGGSQLAFGSVMMLVKRQWIPNFWCHLPVNLTEKARELLMR